MGGMKVRCWLEYTYYMKGDARQTRLGNATEVPGSTQVHGPFGEATGWLCGAGQTLVYP